MHPVMFGKKVEELWALFLSNGHRVLGVKQLSGGGLTCTIVDVRVLMKEALLHGATSIVVCHNHLAVICGRAEKTTPLLMRL